MIYRIYTTTKGTGYKLEEITKDREKALMYAEDSKYNKVLIIEHHIELNMDVPISLTFPSNGRVLKRK